MDHLTMLRTGEEAAQVALQDTLLESVPQFSFDLLVAIMDTTVSDWSQHGLCRKNWSRDDVVKISRPSPDSRFGSGTFSFR